MPQLPIYLAQGSPDARMPATTPDPATLAGHARNLREAGQFVEGLSREMVQASERTREAQQAMAAMRAYSSAAVQAEDLKATLEREPDYETVPARMQEGLKGIFDTHAQQLTDPGARQLFERDFLRLSATKGVEAAHIRNTRRIDRGRADLAAVVDELTDVAGRVAPAELPLVVSRVQLAYRGAAAGGLLTQQEAVDQERKALAQIAEGWARQDVDQDPNGAAERLGAGEGIYHFLDQKQRVQLKEHAGTVSRERAAREWQLQQDTLAAAEKELKQLEKYTEAVRKAQVDALEAKALAGTLTVAEVETAREARVLQGDDYRRVRKAATDLEDLPSDRPTLNRIALDAESAVPRTTEREIDRLYQAGKLSLRDAVELKGKVRQRRQAQSERGTSEVGRRHGQAEQILRSGLTTRSPFEQLDPVSQEMQTMALQEMTRRSAYFDGKEDPLVVAQEIMPKYQQALVDRGRLSVENARKLTGAWTPQTLEQAKERGEISAGEYLSIKDALLKLARAQQDLAAMEARRKAQGKQ